jgi:hypothetical protein
MASIFEMARILEMASISRLDSDRDVLATRLRLPVDVISVRSA